MTILFGNIPLYIYPMFKNLDICGYLCQSINRIRKVIMKQKTLFLILLFSTFFVSFSNAQEEVLADPIKYATILSDNDTLVLPRYTYELKTLPLDSLYERNEEGILMLPDREYTPPLSPYATFADTMIVNPLYLCVIFNGKVLPRDLTLYSGDKESDLFKGVLIPSERTFAPELKKYDFVANRRLDYYRNNPDRINFSSVVFDELPTDIDDSDVSETFNPFKELISTETSFSLEAPTVDGATVKRRYWVRSGDHALQLSQSYFSPNWHRGGKGNFTFLNNHTFRANYHKKKVRFNNTLEIRTSAVTSPDDTLRSFRIADDLLRYHGTFGVDAFGKGWTYSTNMEARTQLFKNHQVNSDVLQSAFLAPLYVNAGIGMGYNLDKGSKKVRHRRVRLHLNLDPVSFSYRYVGHDDVDVRRYGIEEGKKSDFDIGSTVTGNLIYDFNRYINLNTRLKYFTSYHRVEVEMENTLNMALTNAFSTRIYVHLRFDDKVPKHEDYGYLQIHELLSFGLNYRW